MGGGDLTVACQ